MVKQNGKLVIPITIVGVVVTILTGYGELKARVNENSRDIADYKSTPIQIARMEEKVENIEDLLDEQKELLQIMLLEIKKGNGRKNE